MFHCDVLVTSMPFIIYLDNLFKKYANNVLWNSCETNMSKMYSRLNYKCKGTEYQPSTSG